MPREFSRATARQAPDEAPDDDRLMDQSPVPAHVHPRSPWQREAGALPSSVTCSRGTRRPTGSGGVAGGSPRGQGPLASSNSRRLSSRSRSGTSASGATPLPAGMGARRMPRAAATRMRSPVGMTLPGLRGPSLWPGSARSFRSSAQHVAATSPARRACNLPVTVRTERPAREVRLRSLPWDDAMFLTD